MLQSLHAAAILCSLENPHHLDVSTLVLSLHRTSLCPNYAPRLVHSVLAAMRESSATAPYETSACIKIQSTVRMWLQRAIYQRVRKAIIHIQCFYRGFRARNHFAMQLSKGEKDYQQSVFTYYATRIQACFRGYYCRQHRSNYYAMKRYIAKVIQESDQVQSMAKSVQMELESRRVLEKNKVDAAAYRFATEQLHHLLSTKATPGVYSTVRGTPKGFQPSLESCMSVTVWGTNVEDDIKTNNSRLIRAVLLSRQKGNSNIFTPYTATKVKSKLHNISKFSSCTNEQKKNCEVSLLPLVAGSGSGSSNLEVSAASIKDDANNEKAARLHYYRQCFKPNIRVQELSCPYEREDTHPLARPLLVSEKSHMDQPISSFPKTASCDTENKKFERKVNKALHNYSGKGFSSFDSQNENQLNLMTSSSRLAPQNAVSSRSRKFCVPAHDCSRNINKRGDGNSGVGDSSLYDRPIYDTEKEALRRAVDMKMVNHLHGGVPFKVSAAVPNGTNVSLNRKKHRC